jgi:beta-glucosidase/6-phospho-beta-glucosidase/beta-galactosidase
MVPAVNAPPSTRTAPPPGIDADRVTALLSHDLASLARVRVGVSTSSFQTEGGLDGATEPETNWRFWAESGRVERIGPAADLWRRFEPVAARCASLGFDVFRLSIEWARVAPVNERLDRRAVEGYARRLVAMQRAGLEPIVTLQHFTHPAWLGPDFWLDDRSPEMFEHYARSLAESLGEAMIAASGTPPSRILTINEPNMLALATYGAGVFPHRKGALSDGDPLGGFRVLRALDHMMAAHVRAYRALHETYDRRGWPARDVSWNLNAVDVYGLGRAPLDLLRAPERGVAVNELGAYIGRAREDFFAGLFGGEDSPRTRGARAIENILAQVVSPDLFETTLRVLYARPGMPALDSIGIDVYDPWTYQQVRGAQAVLDSLAAGEPLVTVAQKTAAGVQLAEPWEWTYEPEALRRVLRALHDPHAPLPIDIVENGMAERRPAGSPVGTRPDGITRPEFIRGYTFALAEARVLDAIPVRTYCHWSLVDNYELGRWSPRFGLFALEDPRDANVPPVWRSTDAAGHDAAGALSRFAWAVKQARRDASGLAAQLAEYWGVA